MKRKNRLILFLPILLVYIIGLGTDVMEIDAAQYAAMSQEMLQSGKYLMVYDRGQDYLDKPPLLFWLNTLSFRALGISNFSYKLPSLLFSILGIWATFQLGRALYGKTTGWYAALILASCQAWFLMNHDVKTDTLLAGCSIFAIWQLYSFLESGKYVNLVVGSVAIAGAMLTKGPIGVMIPVLSLGIHLAARREWKNIFRWEWLLTAIIVILCLGPMLWGLYVQYDLHPGKMINGVPIQSGVIFYLWTQSFGRITGQSVWQDDTTALYFAHTFLWAFAPWAFLFLVGLWKSMRDLIKSNFRIFQTEALAIGGFVIPFIVFSLSHYKLPHYIFSLFPLAAIITAKYVRDLRQKKSKDIEVRFFKHFQFVIAGILATLVFLLCTISFPEMGYLYGTLIVGAAGLSFFFYWTGKDNFKQIVLPSFIIIMVVNFTLNAYIYPSLFQYVSSNQAARISGATGVRLVGYNQNRYGLDFYSHRRVENYESVKQLRDAEQNKVVWVFANKAGRSELEQSGIPILETRELKDFHISKLNMLFINPTTRPDQLQTDFMLKMDLSN